jgi:hypothetical protein
VRDERGFARSAFLVGDDDGFHLFVFLR